MSMSLTGTIGYSNATSPEHHTVNAHHVTGLDVVPFHQLCYNCSQFCNQWEGLTWLQQSSSCPTKVWPHSRLCAVAHLFENQQCCHLCIFILKAFYRLQPDKVHGLKSYQEFGVHIKQDSRGWGINVVVSKDPLTDEILFDICLVLKTYKHTDTGAFHQHVTAPSMSLQARDNFEIAKGWLQECTSTHEDCCDFSQRTVKDSKQKPTRILQVSNDSVKLLCNMSNEDFDYLALSHMWGEDCTQQIRLMQDTIDTFKEEIPWHRLSNIYKEAIRATRLLGFEYLWIDSLCIIQDSADDWNYEAQRMAIVYGNAACNLSYVFPPGTTSSQRDDPRTWHSCILRTASCSLDGIYIRYRDLEDLPIKDDENWLIQRNWPLFSRAWVFQEYLLAPRTLILGHKNLMWHCSETFYDELLGPLRTMPKDLGIKLMISPSCGLTKSRYFPKTISGVSSVDEKISLSSRTVVQFMNDWAFLAIEYRNRALSHARDRIVAFAGVARAFHHLGSVTYLAGLWKEILPFCLLWHVNESLEDSSGGYTIKVRENVEIDVPTWSWFNIPIYDHHEVFFLFDDHLLRIKTKESLQFSKLLYEDIFWATTHSFTFGANTVNYFPDSGYHDFKGLSITIEMPFIPVKKFRPTGIEAQMQCIRMISEPDSSLQWRPDFSYFPDDPHKSGRGPPMTGFMSLLSEFQVCMSTQKVERHYAGLVLVCGAEKNTWKRVGVWKLKVTVENIDVHQGNIKEVAKRWSEYELLSVDWKMGRITLV